MVENPETTMITSTTSVSVAQNSVENRLQHYGVEGESGFWEPRTHRQHAYMHLGVYVSGTARH